METVALLNMVLYRFRDLFGSQKFSLFCAYIYRVMLCNGRHTVTEIYRASGAGLSYWSWLKFLSRGHWDWQGVCGRLIAIILAYVPDRLYLYDHTYAVKTGKKQFGLQFFRNYRYVKGHMNDLTLSVKTIVYYYTLRWKIETGFRDCKQSFGFDHYREGPLCDLKKPFSAV